MIIRRVTNAVSVLLALCMPEPGEQLTEGRSNPGARDVGEGDKPARVRAGQEERERYRGSERQASYRKGGSETRPYGVQDQGDRSGSDACVACGQLMTAPFARTPPGARFPV